MLLIEPRVFGDERGFFFESWNRARVRRGRHRRRVRAGQPFALAPRRAARTALPDRARAGQARARRAPAKSSTSRSTCAAARRNLRPLGRHDAVGGKPADAVDSARVRARLPGRVRERGVSLQDDRLLVSGARADAALERSGACASPGRSTARRPSAAKDAAGRPLAAADVYAVAPLTPATDDPRDRSRPVSWAWSWRAVVRARRRDGDSIARGSISTDADAIVDAVRALRPQLIVNAAGYTAVDRAEREPELADAVNARAPAILAEEAKAARRAARSTIRPTTCSTERPSTPYAEDAPADPDQRLRAQQVARRGGDRRHRRREPDASRTSWVYGLRGQNFLLTIRRLADGARRVAHRGRPARRSQLGPRSGRSDERHGRQRTVRACRARRGLVPPERARQRQLVRIRTSDPRCRSIGRAWCRSRPPSIRRSPGDPRMRYWRRGSWKSPSASCSPEWRESLARCLADPRDPAGGDVRGAG
mgnify:CR=1 FL=1